MSHANNSELKVHTNVTTQRLNSIASAGIHYQNFALLPTDYSWLIVFNKISILIFYGNSCCVNVSLSWESSFSRGLI